MYPKVCEIHIKLYFGDDYLHFSFPHELTGGDANDFLEKTSEVVRKLKAQQPRGLTDIVALHQHALAYIDDIGVNITAFRKIGRHSCFLCA
jgi:hypothetical protein